MIVMNTVEDNERVRTKRQVECAKMARKLMESLAFPPMQDLVAIIKANLLKDNPVTEEYLRLAEEIYGKEMAAIKGRTVKKK